MFLLFISLIFLYFAVNYDEPPVINDPWNINIPGDFDCILLSENGVIQVYKTVDDLKDNKSMYLLFLVIC